MAKKDLQDSLLDCWKAPVITESIGTSPVRTPIGFISTTFTFDAEFFEGHCLTWFLNIESDKEKEVLAFLVEREEALANLRGGIVLVDQHHCKGNRNLRWDLVPCRISNGIMHAKITILHWSDCIRLIISSANLTRQGQCSNQEIYGVFDYFNGCDSDLSLINEALNYLQTIVKECSGNTVRTRYAELRTFIKKSLQNWAVNEKSYTSDEIKVQLLLISPFEKDGFVRMKSIWHEYSRSLPDYALIMSPFFDNEETPFSPSKQIFDLLQRKAEIGYLVTTRNAAESSDRILVNAPAYLNAIQKSRNQTIEFYEVFEDGKNEESQSVPRPIHLKSISLRNHDLILLLAGSSNFTSAGFGLGRRTNYEANLVYSVSKLKNEKAAKLLNQVELPSDILDKDLLDFQNRPNLDEATDYTLILLPPYFGEAVIIKKENNYILKLQFLSKTYGRPEGLQIFYENSQQSFLLLDGNQLPDQAERFIIDWTDSNLPDYLQVRWNDSNGFAFWPVIVENVSILPVIKELHNLSLEALLMVMGSNQPLYRLLKKIEKLNKPKKEIPDLEKAIDIHKLIDTTGFILQRTRRISYALSSLRIRLEKPVFTKESLEWRLNGPIGARALANAIKREARSAEEKAFLIAELSLELSRVKPQTTSVSLTRRVIKAAIKEVIDKLYQDFTKDLPQPENPISDYSLRAIQTAINELS